MKELHEGIKRVSDAVAKLVKPPLAPLYQVFLEQKREVNAQRTDLLRRLEEVRQEGFEAAVRLRISCSDEFRIERHTYFERIDKKGGNNDE